MIVIRSRDMHPGDIIVQPADMRFFKKERIFFIISIDLVAETCHFLWNSQVEKGVIFDNNVTVLNREPGLP